MKYLELFLLSLVMSCSLALVSCGSDEPDNPYQNEAKKQGEYYVYNNLRFLVTGNSATVVGCENTNKLNDRLDIPNTISIYDKNAAVYKEITVTSIGKSAFANCKKLTSVTFGNSLKSIGEEAFVGDNIESINLPSGNVGKRAFAYNPMQTVVLGDGVERIEEEAFYIAPYGPYSTPVPINNVTIGVNVKFIGHYAFHTVNNLTYNARNCELGGYYIDNSYYEGSLSCQNELTLGNEVEKIPNHCFYFGKFKKVVIPNSVISIGNEAFALGALEEITFGNSVKEIGDGAFSTLYNAETGKRPLKEIYLPNSLETIGNSAFERSGLQKAVMGTGLKYIGNRAFYNCVDMEVFIFKSSTPPQSMDLNFERNASYPLDIYVPDDSFNAYSNVIGYINGYLGTRYLRKLSTYNGTY